MIHKFTLRENVEMYGTMAVLMTLTCMSLVALNRLGCDIILRGSP